MMMKATQERAVAVTAVFWDIMKCPVPPGYDARQVGPCIKRCIENLGYSGPITIFAVGVLTNIPDDVLRAVSSTGIVLTHVGLDKDFMSQVAWWTVKNQPPANLMVISDLKLLSRYLGTLQFELGFNVLMPFPSGAVHSDVKCLLKCFLPAGADSGALEEDKCPETGESAASWFCNVCLSKRGALAGQGFENLTTHLSSQEHAQRVQGRLPRKIRLLPVPPEEAEFEAVFDCPPGCTSTTAVVADTFPPQKVRFLGLSHLLPEDGQDPLADAVDTPLY
ncbi:NYN domain limkain-b1-type, partial [Arabidopsis suecica]